MADIANRVRSKAGWAHTEARVVLGKEQTDKLGGWLWYWGWTLTDAIDSSRHPRWQTGQKKMFIGHAHACYAASLRFAKYSNTVHWTRREKVGSQIETELKLQVLRSWLFE